MRIPTARDFSMNTAFRASGQPYPQQRNKKGTQGIVIERLTMPCIFYIISYTSGAWYLSSTTPPESVGAVPVPLPAKQQQFLHPL